MTTARQKAAINFCEEISNIPFKGDINNFNQVSKYLSLYLDDCKAIWEDAVASFPDKYRFI